MSHPKSCQASWVCGGGVQVRLLVEVGQADVLVKDRWDRTPLDEAKRVGARFVVQYLEVRFAVPQPLSPSRMRT